MLSRAVKFTASRLRGLSRRTVEATEKFAHAPRPDPRVYTELAEAPKEVPWDNDSVAATQITNRSFRYASPHLWNQLPSSVRQPHCVHSPPGSPHPTHITSSQSSLSFSPSVTPDLKLISFTNPFLHSHSYSFRTAFTDLNLYYIKGHWRCLF